MSDKCPKCGAMLANKTDGFRTYRCGTAQDSDGKLWHFHQRNGYEAGESTACLRRQRAAAQAERDEWKERAEKAEAKLDKVCGKLKPDDVAAWIEEYNHCEHCGVDLIGFADRPHSVRCDDCEAAATKDDKAKLAALTADNDRLKDVLHLDRSGLGQPSRASGTWRRAGGGYRNPALRSTLRRAKQSPKSEIRNPQLNRPQTGTAPGGQTTRSASPVRPD